MGLAERPKMSYYYKRRKIAMAQMNPEWKTAVDEIWALLNKTAQMQADTDRRMKETDKRIGELGRRFGEMVEYMVLPNLVERFRELGYEFTKASPNPYITDRKHAILAEVDAFLENGDKVMIVETKTKPNVNDIKDHVERMGKLRAYADVHNDSRKYLGAIAGMVVNQHIKDYALKNGFFVLEPSGATFTITPPEGSPREW
jgi:hypothetical protein